MICLGFTLTITLEKHRIELRIRIKGNNGEKYVSIGDGSFADTNSSASISSFKGNKGSFAL